MDPGTKETHPVTRAPRQPRRSAADRQIIMLSVFRPPPLIAPAQVVAAAVDHERKVPEEKATLTAEASADPATWPRFPALEGAVDAAWHEGQWFLELGSLLHALSPNAVTRSTSRRHLAAARAKFALVSVTFDHRWTAQTWTAIPPQTSPHGLRYADLRPWLLSYMARWRKSRTDKSAVLKRFGLDSEDDTDVTAPIEISVLDDLEAACPFAIRRQHELSLDDPSGTKTKLRLDAYLPRLRIAIEVDEHDHAQYDTADERERETVLRDHNIVLLRFNPHDPDVVRRTQGRPGLELIHRLWTLLESPAVGTFRDRFRLV